MPKTRKSGSGRSAMAGFRRSAAVLRKYALGFPDAYEEFPWGERVIKVNRRIFVFMHGSSQELRVTVKLPRSYGAALLASFARPTGYGLGKSGWVSAAFQNREHAPLDILKTWIEESYRAIAPKRLSKMLDE
ncbi:MAG TPA: MmcQ/YjbR family DNA-binding protein [Gammaproteobacteria bacterium]|nr:MmcQ/YjbR family DNA-binding protein [Gammaproteobacteria bacterium]